MAYSQRFCGRIIEAIMADDSPNRPAGAVPPKASEAPKVQPKKETVRISLPPKPASTATIKLPSLPAGGAGAKPAAAPAPRVGGSASPPPPNPPASAQPGAAISRPGSPAPVKPAATIAARPGAAAGAPAARKAAAGPAGRRQKETVSPLDQGLAIAAGILGLGAVASLLFLLTMK